MTAIQKIIVFFVGNAVNKENLFGEKLYQILAYLFSQ
jgi:hypothetical protein